MWLSDSDVEIPIDFITGTVSILNIHVVGLDTKIANQLNKPYMKLIYGDWNATTVSLESKDYQDFSYLYLGI